MTTRTCANHGDTILWEDGGPDMPTTNGRWYCPSCERVAMGAVDGGES